MTACADDSLKPSATSTESKKLLLIPSLAQAMGVAPGSGALVAQVMPQSAAAKAGILDGDIMAKLISEAVSGAGQLRNAVGRLQPGTAVSLTLLRDGRERVVTATLDQQSVASDTPLSRESQEKTPLSGMMFGPIPRDDPRFGRLEGVYVTDVDPESAAAEAGIRKGDIIVSANRTAVKTPSDLVRMLQSPRDKAPPCSSDTARRCRTFRSTRMTPGDSKCGSMTVGMQDADSRVCSENTRVASLLFSHFREAVWP